MSEVMETVGKFVNAIGSGEMDQAMALLSDDFELHHSTRLPYRGHYVGREGFGELLQKIGAYWDTFEPVPGAQMVPDDDAIVVIGQLRGKPRHRDETVSIRVLERYAVANGRIAHIWPFYIDTHLSEEQVSP